ncbi:tRNA (adenosine(37)-N6)-threonylcarbamoyltransferase complex dimerization subunit type 1 TsaB [Parapedobacter pyrenivorans]|uniref:tRNA (Adenosine(37)-N6)-threonylcarbamoyltransferase complex dimerization subunit type 1 TsaB n=1 Tax=Parapedobacter pyrenivorans TaxID=1305674 RepID=A0A917HQ29_9SPHI|nr:tRNA (adenosine(37)-N6)-threonylcarbamoyltransferase complex dimerization subunit type 1 TsaB [Parapedobacter pyrenivorans]GGG85485.1 tRNA (adenosine(37)-N6)-threonylcarbamoyltransferase complex dimerization subunit type 1 TsaB [Parapedobacter pyrenivorans]
MPIQYILQIETATQVCSVALSANGETVAFRDIDEPNVHAAQLTLIVDELLRTSGLSFKDLEAIAVGKGPGSYTGLRIGISTAKGFCYATDLPLIGVDTLAGMTAGFIANHSPIAANTQLCPMVDARRMEVFAAVYDNQFQPVVPPAATIIDAQSFEHLNVGQRIILFGSGADKLETLFAANEQVEVISHFKNSARHMSYLAYRAFQDEQFADVAYFEPYYLKDFVATTPKPRR